MKNKLKEFYNPPPGCVILYRDCYYSGIWKQICGDLPDFRIIGFNDVASSIKIGSGIEVILLRDINFNGNYLKVQNDIECFVEHNFNDLASSIIILSTVPD